MFMVVFPSSENLLVENFEWLLVYFGERNKAERNGMETLHGLNSTAIGNVSVPQGR